MVTRNDAVIHILRVSDDEKEGLIIPLDSVGFIRCEYQKNPKTMLVENKLTINIKGLAKPIEVDDLEGTVYCVVNDFGNGCNTTDLKEFETNCINALLGLDLYQSAGHPTV